MLIAVLGAIYAVWPVWRAWFPLEIGADEAWNAYHADAVFGPSALYPPTESFISNNYPPLSFVVIKVLSWITGADALYVGRAVSIAAVFVIAGAVFACIRILGGSNFAASLGMVWLAATFMRHFEAYVGVNDPHVMGVAIMSVALAWFLSRLNRQRSLIAPVLLMVVAGFHKHTLIATPATAILWSASFDRRNLFRLLAVGIGASILGLSVCVALFGTHFIDQLLFPRIYSLRRGLLAVERLNPVLAALPICAIWFWFDRNSSAARFSMLFVSVSLATFFFLKIGEGVGNNAQMELAVACAIAVGLALDRLVELADAPRWIRARGGAAIPALLVVGLVALPNIESYLVLGDPSYRAQFHENAATVRREAERVGKMSGLVWCTNGVVCRMAGKPVAYDPFSVSQRIASGVLTGPQVERRMTPAVEIEESTFAANMYRRYWLRDLLRHLTVDCDKDRNPCPSPSTASRTATP